MSAEQPLDRHALHLEDDEAYQGIVKRTLSRAGYNVTTANTLEDALEYSKVRRFYLYVSDGEVPLKSGEAPDTEAGIKFYDFLRNNNLEGFNFGFVSSNTDLQKLAPIRGIKIIGKDCSLGELSEFLSNF